MALGTVKWVNLEKGYGYIAPDGGGLDVYFDTAAVDAAGLTALPVGQRLRFETTPNNGGRPSASMISTNLQN
jgi:CspA family cold shock protein